MVELFDSAVFERMTRRIDPNSRLVRVRPLRGGISAQITALDIVHPDGEYLKVVVRQHGPNDLAHNPQIAADEFRLLQHLYAVGLPVPQPLLLDETRTIVPEPYLVVAFVEGQTELAACQHNEYMRQMAHQLAAIHAVAAKSLAVAVLPLQTARIARLFDAPPSQHEAAEAQRLRDLLQPLWPLEPHNPYALLHGDYWPGNIMWNNGHLAAVLDWEDATRGDPLADLANCRLELLWAHGAETMEQFTSHYLAYTQIDTAQLAYWELAAALRSAGFADWGALPADVAQMQERYSWFVEQALQQVSPVG